MRTVQVGGADRRVYFDIRLLDGITPATSEAGGQPFTSTNGATWTVANIGVLIAIGFGRYYADLTLAAIANVDDIIETRYKGSTTADTPGDSFQVIGNTPTIVPPTTGVISTINYGSVPDGDTYFTNRLNSKKWTNCNSDKKLVALRHATRIVDRLNYAGYQTTQDQLLQFPRFPDTDVPDDIQFATYEIAYALLDGRDPDIDIENLSADLHIMGPSRKKYDRSFVAEHIKAGIPSATAWAYLQPYLLDWRGIRLSRVN